MSLATRLRPLAFSIGTILAGGATVFLSLGGREIVRIAVACAGLEVAPYFAQRTNYMCYDVERGIIEDGKNVPALEKGAMSLTDFLQTLEVDTIIVGRIEYDIASSLCRTGVEVVAGAEGEALEVARAYISKTLSGVIEPCSISDEPDWDEEPLEALV